MVVPLKFSRLLFVGFIVVYSLCGFLISLSPMTEMLRILLILYLLGHSFSILRHYILLLSPKSIQQLIYNEDSYWQLEHDKSRWFHGSLVQAVKISYSFILLGFEVTGKFFPVSVLLAPDSTLERTQWRRLQYLLATAKKCNNRYH